MILSRLLAALLIASGLAACGGSTSTTPLASPTAVPSGTANNTVFNFTGATAAGTATFSTAAGGSVAAGPYAGLTLASTWGTITNFTAAVAMQAWLGSGSGDITSTSTIAFPAFATTAHQDTNGNPLAGTKNLVGYIKLQATPEAIFSQTPGITLTVAAPAAVTGTSCFAYTINNTGTGSALNLVWKQAIPAATVSSTQVVFTQTTLPPGSTVDISNATVQLTTGNGPSYLAVACS